MSASQADYVFEPFKVIEVRYRGIDIPRPRSGHRIVCDDARIYCFGGYNPSLPLTTVQTNNSTWSPSRPLFKELWSFSIASRKWKQHRVLENMPEELASNAMCMNGKYLMIFGGTGSPFGDKCSNDVTVWRTSPGDVKLQILDVTGFRPPEQYGQAIFCRDGHFYTIGGTNGYAYNCDIYRLNLKTMVWEPAYIATGEEGEPIGRYRHEVAQVDNKIYVLGGGTNEWAFSLMEIPMYDIDTETWSTLVPKPDDTEEQNPCAPDPRKCHSAVQINTPDGMQVFVAGGTDGQDVFQDIWRLNMSNLQWNIMRKTVLPNPLYFHSSAVSSYGCMYVFGGMEPQGNATVRNNVLYKVWLCIPKLSEICWEALLNYNPNLDQRDRSSLLKMGIPIHLVKRLDSEPS